VSGTQRNGRVDVELNNTFMLILEVLGYINIKPQDLFSAVTQLLSKFFEFHDSKRTEYTNQ